jgi:hypothetical protein
MVWLCLMIRTHCTGAKRPDDLPRTHRGDLVVDGHHRGRAAGAHACVHLLGRVHGCLCIQRPLKLHWEGDGERKHDGDWWVSEVEGAKDFKAGHSGE